MAQTVIDFGPVDWGRIWGDRATLVTPAHLKELNEISAQTHLANPGYWRNLFASYSEIRADPGKIARLYTRPGQPVQFHETTRTTPIPLPGEANKFSAEKRAKAEIERNELFVSSAEFAKNPFNVAGAVIGQKVKDTPVYQTASKVVDKVTEVGGKVGEIGENLLDVTKNLTKILDNGSKNIPQTASTLIIFGAVITGAYVYSATK